MGKEFIIKRYSEDDKDRWNNFNERCVQQHFFFNRNYMDYHKERFSDFSLIIEDKNKNILALFPANLSDNKIYSHQGLTFGGLLYLPRTFVQKVIDILSSIEAFYTTFYIEKIIYKAIPHIYKVEQAEEDLYALFKNGWKLVRRDFSSLIVSTKEWIPDRSRLKNNKIAIKNNIELKESTDLLSFWNLLSNNLQARHGVNPTHTFEEMQLLSEYFSNNIKLIGAFSNNKMLAGAVIFLTDHVMKIQYSVNSDKGRKIKALDALFTELIKMNQTDFLDFGHSCESNGSYLNEGLARFKYNFNAEGLVFDTYEKSL
ncbi:GNAT family N-acetyltransferase [Flammeovirga pectinis]|uniref:GNAT family N-acetyltransferase n=1 Tax=Flammeovirga pectinis TaxID=2494373 RepID=A0A3S9P8N6_9BACT|nr:GNAT family N-acetyltransferase [Flammeovirga pectinis]AZQ64412.1 GNAT family N-acetyltransferase [Flammeovirga pectinis]